jgi:hypothetical protein
MNSNGLSAGREIASARERRKRAIRFKSHILSESPKDRCKIGRKHSTRSPPRPPLISRTRQSTTSAFRRTNTQTP